ncbi:MAG TPA: bifunctional pyr operon transcriptional regulator/uracil phosphoribosyltransferase PyrR [Chitinophagaceae bacterium]|nr:bifunctional pyr operon transcriptional regulator/uracil phosphoribosyltransferase PyrR [Chitinophagaceae bacterium]
MEIIVDNKKLGTIISELCDKVLLQHPELTDVLFVGIQKGGVLVADNIVKEIQKRKPGCNVQYGQLDITFYRDDIRKEVMAPDIMNLPFDIENKIVVLIDDVLFTGRTIKAALDVLLDYGRPAKVELCVLIDRKEHRQFPIQADYAGKVVIDKRTDKVKLVNNEVILISQ